MPASFLLLLVALNALTLLAFGWDKLCARMRWRRVRERRLLWLAALGGIGGAKAGQVIFRHKSRKRAFRNWLNAILLAQAVALAAFLVLGR
jgi:uncharacterized membrane protein YsdA (DUF1294 family)